jgi:hypothetical protein
MKPSFLWILALLSAGPCWGQGADFPAGPGPVIADAAHDPAWSALFAQLAPVRPRQSAFTEERFFPFRRRPVVLTGVVRIDPGRGLSLAYLTPEVRTLIIDRQGLLLRDSRGREEPAPADSRMQAATTALVSVLRFDLPELERDFILRGQRLGARWHLTLTPRQPELAAGLRTLIVRGEDGQLSQIELLRGRDQRILITLRGTADPARFTPAEIARYFR